MNKTNPGVALVTGASSGIGHATAKALQNAGFRVFGTSRRAAERSDGITMVTCDVTDDQSVAKLVDGVLAEAGRIDLLVNNAGIGLLGAAEESSTAQAQALFDVNVFGTWWLTKAAMPALKSSPDGNVVNVTSLAGIRPTGSSIAYAMTKAALNHLTLLLAKSQSPVRVNAVAPGLVDTPWTADWDDRHAAIARMVPAHRSATPKTCTARIFGWVNRNSSISRG